MTLARSGSTGGATLADVPAHSYREDPLVPAFPDDHPLIVFDGVCVLCSRFARFVAARDRAANIRFTAAQSPLGQALFRHYGLDTVNFETNLFIKDGHAYARMEAFVAIMRELGGIWRGAALMLWLPRGLRNWFYERIARNRYALFGKRDSCMIPDETWRARMID